MRLRKGQSLLFWLPWFANSSMFSIEQRLTKHYGLIAVFYSSFSLFSKFDSRWHLDLRTSFDKMADDLSYFVSSGTIFWGTFSYLGFFGHITTGVFSSPFYSFSFLLTFRSISGLPLIKLGCEKIFFVGSFRDLWKPYIFN